MAFFSGLSERFWSYVSPRKTQQRRNKPFKVPPKPPPRRHRKSSEALEKFDRSMSMSPNTRVKSWKVSRPDSRTPGRMATPQYPITPTSSVPDAEADTVVVGGFGGDTLVSGAEGENSMNASDETVVETKYELQAPQYFDLQKERDRQVRQARDMRVTGWSEDAIRLFQKIGMRGYEPLMPEEWLIDFPTIPPELFSGDGEKVFLKSASGKDFRATKALDTLISAGARARDVVFSTTTSKEPEQILHRAISNYMKWALGDGAVNKEANIPVFDYHTGNRAVAPTDLEMRMLEKLSHLANRYREVFRLEPSVESDDGMADGSQSQDPPSDDALYSHELPALYGFVISHTLVGVVNYDITPFAPKLRIVATFDFGEPGYDVWNSLGVAIVAVHCRNKMMELAEFMPEVEVEPSDSDPDA